MIDALQNSEALTGAARKILRPDAAPDVANGAGFSFGAAVVALEGRAAQSLKTFGGAPSGEGAALSKPTSDTSQQNGSDVTRSDPSQQARPSLAEKAAISETSMPANDRPVQNAALTQPSLQLAAATPTVLLAPAATATAATSASAQQRIEIPALRSNDVKSVPTLKTLSPEAAREPRAPAQDFARVLARRLSGGATHFEVRLDPPELGRVEAQLRLGDKGDAVLAMKFENQTALDLFSRDESALRAQLEFAGFDFNGKQLAFSLADNNAPVLPDNTGLPITMTPTSAIAKFSAGLIDIQV